MHITELKTERLILNQVTKDDAKSIFEYASNPEVSKWVTFPTHLNIDDTMSFINYLLSQEGDDFAWAIRHRDNKKLIGTIDFCIYSNNSADMHYCLSNKYWNRGIITEAAQNVLNWGFKNYPNIERVLSGAVNSNIGSHRVLEKCGFKRKEKRFEKWDKYTDPVVLIDYVLEVNDYIKVGS